MTYLHINIKHQHYRDNNIPFLHIRLLKIIRPRPEAPTPGGAHQGPWADELAMPGCCTPVGLHGAEEGGMDCSGRGGHQTPGPNMEAMDGGVASWVVTGWPDWATGGGISMAIGADALLLLWLISPLLGMTARVWRSGDWGRFSLKSFDLAPGESIWRARNRFGGKGMVDLALGRGSGARDRKRRETRGWSARFMLASGWMTAFVSRTLRYSRAERISSALYSLS